MNRLTNGKRKVVKVDGFIHKLIRSLVFDNDLLFLPPWNKDCVFLIYNLSSQRGSDPVTHKSRMRQA